MDYEKKYKEAVNKIKNLLDDGEKNGFTIVTYKTDLESIFPELKESEDERIRKRIIHALHGDVLDMEEINKAIVWLEKQGEQKPAVEMKTPEESLGIDSDTYNEIVDECIYSEQKSQRMISAEAKEAMYDKPSDKVEPKFKVGDWVVYYRNDSSREVLQVYDIRDGRYYFTDNVHFSWSVKECDEKSHLWTIEDARDGDILVYKDEIFLFNCVDNDSVLFHCCYDDDDLITDSFYAFINRELSNVHPATNEQCDTLMKAMADAGYTFDFAKKELKKIEQKSAEWSKEDDAMLDTIEGWLDTLCEYLKDSRCEYIPNVKYCIDRLKSLKQRYTWKPSDEQMATLYKYAEQNNYDGSILTSLYNDLKKLREKQL